MKFISNRIVNPTSGGPTFDQWLAQFILQKQASEAKPGTGLPEDGGDPRDSDRGQVINNDNEDGANSYQRGESVDGKSEQGGNARPDTGGTTDQKENKQTDKEGSAKCKECDKKPCKCASAKTAKCGKEMGESSGAGKVTEEHTDAAPGDDNSDLKVKINDDPNYQKGESVDPAKATGKSKKGPNDPVVGKGKKSSLNKFRSVTAMDRLSKLQLFASMSVNKSYHIGKYRPLEYIESVTGLKLANMTPEEKEFFKDLWRTQYGEDYVELMCKDR